VARFCRRLGPAGLLCLALMLSGAGPASGAEIATGVYLPGSSAKPALLDRYAREVGRRPVVVSSYKDWSSLPFSSEELDGIWSRGGIAMITWEPWTAAEKGFSLRGIAEGRYDRYLRRAAGSAAKYGKPIMVRFAQEMNGDWFPWGRGVGGNTPREFRKAWKHVVDLFRFHGATNVIWVWSPNEDSGGTFQFAPLYPGDEWVDWVALDGFNFGADEGWPSFTTVFGGTYDRLVKLTRRPLMIAETGSDEDGGDKAAWITSALGREAPRFPHLRAVVWFDSEASGADFRVASSPGSLRAFRTALAAPAYGATREQLLATPSRLPGAAAAPEPPDGGYGAPSLWEKIREKVHGPYLVAAIAALLVGLALVVLAASLLVRRRRRRRTGAAPAQ
jgi:Glycosyl hydrolase family 26